MSVDGGVVGVLHHVQDVTASFSNGTANGTGSDLRTGPASPEVRELRRALRLLEEAFPDTHPETLIGVLTDSHRVVSGVVGAPDPARVLEATYPESCSA